MRSFKAVGGAFARALALAALWAGFAWYSYGYLSALRPAYRLLGLGSAVSSTLFEQEPPPADPRLRDRLARIESQLRPRFQVSGHPVAAETLLEAMRDNKVPALAVAVIDQGRIDWARAYGVLRSGASDPATSNTLFQAASVTKPTLAAISLSLVDHGRLSLDTDVNTVLKGWHVPNPWPQDKVTLRRLLSHSAGANVYGGRGGYPSRGPAPSLPALLEGQPPSVTAAVRVTDPPGSVFHYSNGGYMVVNKLLCDVTGESLEELGRKYLFYPAQMFHSTYASSPDERAYRVASGHAADGLMVPGRWRLIPEGLLWTTASDLADFIIAIQQSFLAQPSALLSPGSARQMLTRQIDSWGLGFQIKGAGGDLAFLHSGSTPGYKAFIFGYAMRGQGVAILTNGDRGMEVGTMLLTAIAREYNWPDYRDRVLVPQTVNASTLEQYAGAYQMTPDATASFEVEHGFLMGETAQVPKTALYSLGSDRFFATDGTMFQFERNRQNTVNGLMVDDWFHASRVQSGR